MSMQELPEDDLDGLFRKSAEEFEPTFEPADWKNMKARLDEHDRKLLGGNWVKKSLIGLVVVLFFGISWYSWQVINAGGASARLRPGPPAGAQEKALKVTPEPTEKQQSTSAKEAEEPSVRQLSNSHIGKQSKAGEKAAPESVSGRITAKNQLPSLEEQPQQVASDDVAQRTQLTPVLSRNETKANRKPEKIYSVEKQVGSVVVAQGTNSVRRSGRPATKQEKAGNLSQPLSENPQTTSVSAEPSASERANAILSSRTQNPEAEQVVAESEQTGIVDERTTWTIPPVATLLMKWPVFAALDDPEAVRPETAGTQPGRSAPKTNGLSVRAMVAPDLTTIGLKNFTRPGSLMGLQVAYRFAKRWSVQAGGLWNKKVYEAYGSEYAWPSNWKYQPKADEVAGSCKMVDIPINVRYDFLLVPHPSGGVARWFTSAGVTSFVMLNERYDYIYANPSDPRIQRTKWEGASGRYGFSHMNLSIGYERPLTHRLAWQIEPFMKMPLKGIGFFKINLITTGAFLSLRYKL